VLVVINGSIASGKSTIARAYARCLAARGIAVAVIDLDLLYDMHHHTPGAKKDDEKTWATARRAAAALTDAFLS
jgi:uridine kinase